MKTEHIDTFREDMNHLMDMLEQSLRDIIIIWKQDTRQTELDAVLKAANMPAIVTINSTCPQTRNGAAHFDSNRRDHRVTINPLLNKQLTQAEAMALIAHEVSHLKQNDGYWHRKWVQVAQWACGGISMAAGLGVVALVPDMQWLTATAQAATYRTRRWPQRMSVWASIRHEYRADADVIRWLGPSYALPLAGSLYKATRMSSQRKTLPANPDAYRVGWRTHPPLVRRLRALGVTWEQVQTYLHQQRWQRRLPGVPPLPPLPAPNLYADP